MNSDPLDDEGFAEHVVWTAPRTRLRAARATLPSSGLSAHLASSGNRIRAAERMAMAATIAVEVNGTDKLSGSRNEPAGS
ncbi:MAG: hypothetical protein R3A46_06700 [Thermomicrobiales bacterium]